MALYTTGELAKRCGVTVRTVQYYDAKDLLKPSELTEGGRRLYTEEDANRLDQIVFLKDLGFSLKAIASLLAERNIASVLGLLIEDRKRELESDLVRSRRQLDQLRELKSTIDQMVTIHSENLGAIAAVMGNKKKLRNMRIAMVCVGIVMDAAWIAPLVVGITTGVWWPLAIGITVAIILGIIITYHYMTHTAYICPDDQTVFRPPFAQNFFARHTPSLRKLTCPTCGNKSYCLEIYIPDTVPRREGGYLIWDEGNKR